MRRYLSRAWHTAPRSARRCTTATGMLRTLTTLVVGVYVFVSSSPFGWIADGRALRWRAIDQILLQLDDALLNATSGGGGDGDDRAAHARACQLLMTPAERSVAVGADDDLQLPRLGVRIALWLYVGHEVAFEALQTTGVGLMQSVRHAYALLSTAWREHYHKYYSPPSECRSEDA